MKQVEIAGLPVHPLANLFPMMGEDEIGQLANDIAEHDLEQKITLMDGAILDGRNRAAALEKLDRNVIEYAETFTGTEDDALAFVLSRNLHRRHLTADQRRVVIGKFIRTTPEASDRRIASEVKVSPTTVGKVRAELEAAGEVSNLDTRVGSDGKEQPAHKPVDDRKRDARNFERREQHAKRGRNVKSVTNAPPNIPRRWSQPDMAAYVIAKKFNAERRQKFVAVLRSYPEIIVELRKLLEEVPTRAAEVTR